MKQMSRKGNISLPTFLPLKKSEQDEDKKAAVAICDMVTDNLENLESNPPQDTDVIEIVGMSCRFPGNITDLHTFWKFLSEGKHVSETIPKNRWDNDALLDMQHNMTQAEKRRATNGAFVYDMESFDPSFFGISAVEARAMGPQHRVLLECTFQAFSDADYTLDSLKGQACGVFIGMRQNSNASKSGATTAYDATANTMSAAAGRVSFFFDLHGPCVAYDTAHSSSLVALNAAVSALKNGECELALVAGVNELFDPQDFLAFSAANMLSPTGRCHTWDSAADGYLRGEA